MTRKIAWSLLTLMLITNTAMAAATNVRGRVLASDGATPYPSVGVTLQGADGKGATVYTDRQGMFRIDGVAPGAYNLQITTPRSNKTFKVTAEAKEFTDISPVSVP
jgi:hypothetical protein